MIKSKLNSKTNKLIFQFLSEQFFIMSESYVFDRITGMEMPPSEIQELIVGMFDIDHDGSQLALSMWLYEKGVRRIMDHWDGMSKINGEHLSGSTNNQYRLDWTSDATSNQVWVTYDQNNGKFISWDI